jgi:hypothetical protein
MSKVKRIAWTNRLGKLLSEPGGITVADALRKAGENLDGIREEGQGVLDGYLAEIEALRAGAGPAALAEVKAELYRLANKIHATAAVFGLAQLGEAAFSLCELIDRLRERGRWNGGAVDVHLSALRIFRRPDEQVDGEAVLAGLGRVIERERRPEARTG